MRTATIPRRKSLRRPVPDERRTFTVAEVADIVGISRSTAYECVRRGEIPSRRFGRPSSGSVTNSNDSSVHHDGRSISRSQRSLTWE